MTIIGGGGGGFKKKNILCYRLSCAFLALKRKHMYNSVLHIRSVYFYIYMIKLHIL